MKFRQPGSLPKGYKDGKASSSDEGNDAEDGDDDDIECIEGVNYPARIMPDPRYYYKGFYFRECSNEKAPNDVGPIELIESLKSMEEVNRYNPDFKEFEVDSESEYELEPDPDPSEFDSWHDYLSNTNKKADEKAPPKKYIKLIDGMTRPQRREHRQFALEFKDLLEALEENHMAHCEKGIKKFSQPFIPPEGFRGRTSGQILEQAQNRMNEYLRKNAFKELGLKDPADIKHEPRIQQRFSEMDLKPLVNMNGMNWRDLLPRKPPKDGEEDVSSESSATTDSDDPLLKDPKPLEWDAAGKGTEKRPPEWDRYRSTNERILYRRYIRRACRTILKSNKRKKKIHKLLQIGSYAPKRPIPVPPTRIPPAIVDDEELMEIPNYMSAREMIYGADPEHKSILIKFFNDLNRRDIKRIKEYEKAAAEGPVPRYIYFGKYQMKTLYTSPLPFHLRIKDEIFLCDQCLGGWIDRDTYERHTI
uniref:MYST zinc finger domain-containing protein n=1 Tax=Panagrolaimus superbus TaxID=310955 RepID=A0A914YYD8_9BILA